MGKSGEVPALGVQFSQPEMLGGCQPELAAPSLGVGMTPVTKAPTPCTLQSAQPVLRPFVEASLGVPGRGGGLAPQDSPPWGPLGGRIINKCPSALKSDPI